MDSSEKQKIKASYKRREKLSKLEGREKELSLEMWVKKIPAFVLGSFWRKQDERAV